MCFCNNNNFLQLYDEQTVIIPNLYFAYVIFSKSFILYTNSHAAFNLIS